MLFLVDGYNVTKGDPATRSLSLEAQRDALVARLRTRGSQLLGAGRIEIVFDGATGQAHTANPLRSDTPPVHVVFSRDASADDAIVAIAARSADRVVCVVTSDSGLVERLRTHSGSSVEIRARESVFERAKGRPRSGPRGGVAREVGLPKGANAITKELKDVWLKDEE